MIEYPQYIHERDLNKAAHHLSKGLACEVVVDDTGRASFVFPADKRYFEESASWDRNEPIPCLDFASEIRRLRARMLTAKAEKGKGYGYGRAQKQ